MTRQETSNHSSKRTREKRVPLNSSVSTCQETVLGNCRFCGKPAGFLRGAHKFCREEDDARRRAEEEERRKRDQAVKEAGSRIVSIATAAMRSDAAYASLEAKLVEIVQANGLRQDDCRPLLAQAWEQAVNAFLDDGVLDASEEKRLSEFRQHFSLTQDELDRNGALTKTVKAAVLRDVLSGKVPERLSIDGTLPINFQKKETLIWAFSGAQYLEDKTRRHYVGGSQGVSVRVMKGVYYRVGAFKAQPVETTERTYIDSGWVAITNKNIYFAGSRKSVRVPYTKIVSFEPFSDGFGIMRDAVTAKPQIFVTGDGWFSYNLVTNAAHL